MLDELPEGPFSIICSYYEHLPAFQRLTLQQLEAAPQEDDELDPDYEPGADSSSEDEEDEELEEDRWRRNTDEYGGFIFDKDRDGPADVPDEYVLHDDFRDFVFPVYARAQPPHHNIVATLVLCRMACVCHAMRDLVNTSAQRLRNERWEFIQQDASMAFARDVYAAMERWPQWSLVSEINEPRTVGPLTFERLTDVQAVAVFDALIMDSVDAVQLQAGPGLADYIGKLREGGAWDEQTDTNKMQTATYLQIDRSGYNDSDRPRANDAFPILRVCCPLARMDVAYDSGADEGERYPMVWEASRLDVEDDEIGSGIIFTDCSEAQNFSIHLDGDKTLEEDFPYTLAGEFSGLNLDYVEGATVQVIHLKWVTVDGTRYTFLPMDQATHAAFCRTVNGGIWDDVSDKPIFVVEKEKVLPLLPFVPKDRSFRPE